MLGYFPLLRESILCTFGSRINAAIRNVPENRRKINFSIGNNKYGRVLILFLRNYCDVIAIQFVVVQGERRKGNKYCALKTGLNRL